MSKVFVLDTGPTGRIAHPRPNPDMVRWLDAALAAGDLIILPEITDYELRRNFLLEIQRGNNSIRQSLQRLDQLKVVLSFLPINSEAMQTAAQLWADVRSLGQPTADRHALDGDAILAAQTLQVNGTVVTENAGHLNRFVPVTDWQTP